MFFSPQTDILTYPVQYNFLSVKVKNRVEIFYISTLSFLIISYLLFHVHILLRPQCAEDDASAITAKYDKSTEDTMGMIYITGPVKKYTSYRIIINGVSYFVVYPTKQEQILKEKSVFYNSKAEPHWIDNRTIAFKIPFGEWNISYSFDYETAYHDRTTYIKDTVSLDKVHVTLNKNHPIAKLKKNNKFFCAKLIEI